MSEFEDIFNLIKQAHDDELKEMELRALKAECDYDEVMITLIGVFEKFGLAQPKKANPTPKAKRTSVSATSSRPKGAKVYPDAIFINALKPKFQTQSALKAALSRAGVSAGTVHSRFKKLAADPASGVERDDHGGYRLNREMVR